MKTPRRALFAAVLWTALGLAGTAAQAKTLTLCWAAWDPANALVELSKDFTKQSGIEMKFEFVPWTSYADRFLNEPRGISDYSRGDAEGMIGNGSKGPANGRANGRASVLVKRDNIVLMDRK